MFPNHFIYLFLKYLKLFYLIIFDFLYIFYEKIIFVIVSLECINYKEKNERQNIVK